MRHSYRWRWPALLLCGLFAALPACSSDPATVETELDSSAANEGGRYAILDSKGWELREAVKSLAGEGSRTLEPSRDWWAEYERLVPVDGGREGQDVRVSGHDVSLVEHRNELQGVVAQEGEVNGRPALLAVGPEGQPAIVTIAFAERYTIMVLSYALPLEELRRVATQLVPADEIEWMAHGGEIIECLPTDPRCEERSGG